jgi:two-component system OmpR family response regulator
MRILVIEDESAIADFLERGLRAEGYSVSCAATAREGERQATAGDVDLVILDRRLPGADGLEVLDRIRETRRALPVIVLTALGEIEDRVEGLDRGATDYMAKPFSFDELTARVRAHLRPSETEPDIARLSAGGIELDFIRREVTRDGVEVHLSRREFDLLAYLLRHPGQVVSRQELLSAVWGYDHEPGTNVVQVYVGYLRRKLAQPGNPAPLETVRSAGYRLAVRG